MSKDFEQLKTRNHAVYRMFMHCVFSVKYRHLVITKEMLLRLEEIFTDLAQQWGCSLVEFGGEADHVHLLLEIHPLVEITKLVKNFKSVSSRRIRKEFVDHLKQYFWKPYFWSRAYSCITVGGRANIETLLKYIENQDEPIDHA